jgi:hypothetical protein
MRTCLGSCLLLGLAHLAFAGDRAVVERTPGLVAFWTFGEEAGQARVSSGTRDPHPLREVGGPISRVAGGPFSGYAADLDGKRYFTIPYAETGDLNISGPEAQVSMFAVVRIVNLKQSRTIAGMWSEGKGANDDTGTRQYALLMNMPTYGGPNKLVPHISSEGGVTRRANGSAFPWCCDYAVSTHEVPTETWCTLGFTYDGRFIRAYVNGGLDELKLDPVVHKRTDRYFTHEGPGGGDRGMNPYYHGRGIFRYDPAKHAATKPGGGSDFTVGARYAVGKMLGEATIGRFGGLAVFNRALNDAEMKRLHDAADVSALNQSDNLAPSGNAHPAGVPVASEQAQPALSGAQVGAYTSRVRHYAVVVGGKSGAPLGKGLDWFYWRSVSGMHEKLKSRYGYFDDNIYCLYEYSAQRAEARSLVDGVATKKNFRAVMKHLAAIMRPGDELFLFLIDHGDFNATTFLVDAPLGAAELNEMLDALPSQQITIALNYCGGGSWIPHLSAKGRVVCTAVSAKETDGGWAECFRETICGEKPEADRNKDGRFSVLEAYLATVVNAKSRGGYHPQLDDNGDGKSHHPDDRPDGLGDDGQVAAQRFLGNAGAALTYSDAEKEALRRRNASLALDR